MSIPVVELSLAATQIALRYLEFAERAQAGEMTEAELQASWGLLEQRKEDVRARLQQKLVEKREQGA